MPSLRLFDSRAVLNTGTWLKRFEEVPPRLGFLPKIFDPIFCLNYLRVSLADRGVAIDYRTLPKDKPRDLSLLQRLLLSRKRGPRPDPIPERTVLET